ncbi:Integrase catalytic domain-containing protein [Citrus sinensis]|uniref:Integrase catalytic domain-containing protein n=1 Tax=Citrus sinensis TaxID=2711 RepID=A0ACB8KHN0_CITSI|nr:Integrase catalytic domain-containing protein [Citrus sinensis]
MEIAYDKWNEIDGSAISYLHLALADGVLSSVENERAELLLQSLPDSYDQLIINLTNNNPVDSLVFDDFAASVLNEESRQKNKENRRASSQQAEALSVTRGRSTECGLSGSQNHGRLKSRNSGATWHMTSRREWFHTYEPILGGSVYMRDDHALEIAGTGTIKIKMFDGTIRTIEEVRHVNGLKKNILSLGQMDSHGYKTHVENEIMKIVKGALVLMKAEKIGANLFMLKGETLQEADVCVASNGEESTMITCWVYPIKKKLDVFLVFKEYKARVELESSKKIKCLRTDNDGEYTDGEFLAFCKQKDIQRQFTVAYTPQQNRVAERMNKTLTERIRAMLKTTDLPNLFWAEPTKTACYIVNRSPSTAIGLKTAMEIWTGKPADYSYLHVFGCPVYVMYNAQERTKLDTKSKRCIFLGYADGVKGYHGGDSTVKEKSGIVPVYVENNQEDSDSFEVAPEHEEQELVESEAPEVRRLTRERRPPTWHSEYVTEINVAYCLLAEDGEPSTFYEALESSDIKRDGNDQVERYRARLVVKGYAQKEGIDFNEIFSPVVRLTIVRVVLTMCAIFDLHLEQLDVKTAFLYGELEEEIYMLQPEVGAVRRYMANPGGEHWIVVKRILRYIRGTSDVALCYGGSEFTVRGYVDSDFAGDLDKRKSLSKRKSTTGYVFTFAGAAVSWVSKLQTVVALSTTEVEYMAATQACKEVIWIQRLLEELGHKQEKISMFCDSQSALHIARNPAFHSRTKHIVEDGNVDLQNIHTKENLAYVLTKPINTDKFVWSRSSCGLAET